MSKLAYQSKLNVTASLAILSIAMGGVTSAAFAAPPPTLSPAPSAEQPSALPPTDATAVPSAAAGTTPPPAAIAAPAPEAAPPAADPISAAGDAVAPPGFEPPPTFTPPTALPSAAQPPSGGLSAASTGEGSAPAFSDVIGQQNGQIEQPAALPPGFDLPLEGQAQGAGTLDEKSKEEKEAELRKKAFDSAINGLFALHPEEVRRLLERSDEHKQAVEVPIYSNPTPESSFATISLDPGEKPLEVKTAIGHVTTLSMVDATGQPWPIKDITWAGNFEVLQPEDGSNMLRITPLSEFAQGNVSMRMVGLNPPIIMTFKADRQTVHVRLDVQVPEIGPNGVAPLINSNLTGATAGNAQLASVLEGVIPSKARKMTLNGVDGRTSAYDMGGTMYVRTPYTLLSPAWNSSVRSADGTNVYALASTPVLILSDKGKMVRAYLSGEEKADGQ